MKKYFGIYLKSYSENVFGIDQKQYIIVLNYLMWIIFAFILFNIIAGRFRIKNIGKDGLELERVIEEKNLEALQSNTEIVSNIYTEMAELDKVIDFLYSINKLNSTMSEKEYLEQIQLLCYCLSKKSNNITFRILSINGYETYLKELGLARREINLLKYRFKSYNIIKVEGGIHIKYDYAPFHSFLGKETNCFFVVMKIHDLFDINLGKLVYSYLKVFESLYAKYILLNQDT